MGARRPVVKRLCGMKNKINYLRHNCRDVVCGMWVTWVPRNINSFQMDTRTQVMLNPANQGIR